MAGPYRGRQLHVYGRGDQLARRDHVLDAQTRDMLDNRWRSRSVDAMETQVDGLGDRLLLLRLPTIIRLMAAVE